MATRRRSGVFGLGLAALMILVGCAGPHIRQISLSNSREITQCEETVLTAVVESDVPDTLSFDWVVTPADPGGESRLWAGAEQATFTGSAGLFDVELSVRDAQGAARKAVSIGVEAANCPLPPESPPPVPVRSIADLSVVNGTSGFGTADGAQVLALSLGGFLPVFEVATDEEHSAAIAALQAAIASGFSLVRSSDDALVEGEVLLGLFDIHGVAVGGASGWVFSFVPAAPLDEGWYRLLVDLGPALDAGLVPPITTEIFFEGELFTRFYAGSQLMYTTLRGRCEERVATAPSAPGAHGRQCFFTLPLSEPVSGSDFVVAAAGVSFAYDGAPVDCLPISDPHRSRKTELSFLCREPPAGAEITARVASVNVRNTSGVTPSEIRVPFAPPAFEESTLGSGPIWVLD